MAGWGGVRARYNAERDANNAAECAALEQLQLSPAACDSEHREGLWVTGLV